MEIVNVYIDGPNLLGAVSDLRKKRVWVNPLQLSNHLINKQTQEIKAIFYAETPYPENLHSPGSFRKQQIFFGKIYTYIQNKEVFHIKGSYRVDTTTVPLFIVNQLKPDVQNLVKSLSWKKPMEKGGDVGLAVRLVRDAFRGEFDHAILVTADQDFAPAVNIVLSDAKKKVSIAYVNNSYRNALALRNKCEGAGFIQITRKIIDACEMS
ncbi:MAG: NYN domain-containing protein [Chlamydiae bacterium]|nr:NYN domain-containing protein [Chlamydiota bacterium]